MPHRFSLHYNYTHYYTRSSLSKTYGETSLSNLTITDTAASYYSLNNCPEYTNVH